MRAKILSLAMFCTMTIATGIVAGFAMGIIAGCRSDSSSATPKPAVVVLYTSVDEPFAREVVAEFEKTSGIKVNMVNDTEASKTAGLARRIRAERNRPQCDVLWQNDLFSTIRLAREGIFEEYRPPAEGIPDRYKDPNGQWVAFSPRARVLMWNTTRVQRNEVPTKWHDIADPKWKGKLVISNPQFGTATAHFAAMLALWGEPAYVAWLQQLNDTLNGELQDGNSTVARRVGTGEKALGAVDTDDVFARQLRKEPVEMLYPDLGDGGTLLNPNSVALIKNAPHPDAARVLIDFLTSETTERLLARSESRNFPVRESLQRELNMPPPPETKLSFDKIADVLEQSTQLASQYLVH